MTSGHLAVMPFPIVVTEGGFSRNGQLVRGRLDWLTVWSAGVINIIVDVVSVVVMTGVRGDDHSSHQGYDSDVVVHCTLSLATVINTPAYHCVLDASSETG